MLSLPPERPICHRGQARTTEGAVNVDAARAGQSGDPAADCRDHQREGARGPARAGRGVRPPVLRPPGPRGPARAGPGRPLRRRPGPLAPGPPPPARRGPGPGLQPPLRGARLALQALDRGDRHRRHAVPGRLGGHGAEPQRPGHPPAHPPGGGGAPRRGRRAGRGAAARRQGRHPRVVPALRGRPPERPRGAGPAAGRRRAGPGGRQGLDRGLGRDARAGPDDPGGAGRAAAPGRRGRAGRGQGAAGVDRGPPLHLPRLPVLRPGAGEGPGHAAPGAGHRPRHPAPGPVQAGLGQLRQAAAGGQAAGPGAAHPRPDQGELPLDRAPAVVPGLHRGQAVRRAGRGRRRAPLPRPLHLGRLQPEPARHPGAAPQGDQGAGAGRPAALQPRLEVAAEHPGDLPPRRAVPDLRRPAVRDGHGHPAAGGAPPGAAVHVARRLRPLRLLPWSTCPATATRPPCAGASRWSCTRPSRGRTSTSRCGCRSRCWPGCTSSSGCRRARCRATTPRTWRPSWPRSPGPGTTSSTPCCWSCTARRRATPCTPPTARRSRPPTWTTSRPATPSTTSSGWRTWPSAAAST